VSQHPEKTGLLDEYDRNSRLKPALLTILPASFLVLTLGTTYSLAVGVLTAPLTALGFTYVLAQLARDWGKRKQMQLFRLWGGKPTTAKLRHSDATLNPHTRSRYHKIVGPLVGKTMPSPSEEAANPESADLIYETVGDDLRERTRDRKKFPLVFKELVSYGFRRNLWGMKRFGICLACLAIAAQFVILISGYVQQHAINPPQVLATICNILILCGWIVIVTPSWVKIPADAYAEQLLASCQALDLARKSRAERKKAS
jgi:hypothetical protein